MSITVTLERQDVVKLLAEEMGEVAASMLYDFYSDIESQGLTLDNLSDGWTEYTLEEFKYDYGYYLAWDREEYEEEKDYLEALVRKVQERLTVLVDFDADVVVVGE